MNFKNLQKSDILKIAEKIHFSQNFKSLVFFWSRQARFITICT